MSYKLQSGDVDVPWKIGNTEVRVSNRLSLKYQLHYLTSSSLKANGNWSQYISTFNWLKREIDLAIDLRQVLKIVSISPLISAVNILNVLKTVVLGFWLMIMSFGVTCWRYFFLCLLTVLNAPMMTGAIFIDFLKLSRFIFALPSLLLAHVLVLLFLLLASHRHCLVSYNSS